MEARPISDRSHSEATQDLAAARRAERALRVLVAEDHAIIRGAVVDFLANLPGIEVIGEASDGDEAVSRAEELNPDVIVLDVSMPIAGGVKAGRIILDKLPHVRIVFLTIHGRACLGAMDQSPRVDYVAKSDGLDKLAVAVLGRDTTSADS